MIVIGIDPGKTGALAAINSKLQLLEAINMPLVSSGIVKTPSQFKKMDTKERYKKNKAWWSNAEPYLLGIVDFLDRYKSADIVMERLGFRGKQTGLSVMADNYALIYHAIGVARGIFIPHRVDAKTWAQNYPECTTSSKKERQEFCHELGWHQITNSGKADAALIAHWWATK